MAFSWAAFSLNGSSLSSWMARCPCRLRGNPAARATLRNGDYANELRDLVGVEVDPQPVLPSDEQAYGLENNADALSMQPALLDRYLTAATSAA